MDNREGFGINHDIILHYSKSGDVVWNPQYQKYDDNYLRTHYRSKGDDGRRYELDQISAAGPGPARYFFGKLIGPLPEPIGGGRKRKSTNSRQKVV